MARVLVVYASESGNTERMALAVAEGVEQVENVEVIMQKIEQASLDDLCSSDGITIGSPTYYGQISGRLKTVIDKSVKIHGRLEGKVGAASTSADGTATGAEITLLAILKTMLVHGMIIQGRSDDMHYGSAAVCTPHKKEIEYCKELGRRVAHLAPRLQE